MSDEKPPEQPAPEQKPFLAFRFEGKDERGESQFSVHGWGMENIPEDSLIVVLQKFVMGLLQKSVMQDAMRQQQAAQRRVQVGKNVPPPPQFPPRSPWSG